MEATIGGSHLATTMLTVLLFLFIFLNSYTTLSNANSSTSDQIHPVSFSFYSFNNQSCNNGSKLICMGSVIGGNGYLGLTDDTQADNSSSSSSLNEVGRVLYYQPVTAWPAAISTSFTVRILTNPKSNTSGDGLAFIMAQDSKPSPPNSYGGYLGIMDKSTQDGKVRQIAVELDTYSNEFDPDGNHIGIDTTSIITPLAAKTLNGTGIDLKSGKDINVRIDYSILTRQLQVFIAYAGNPMISFLNESIDMTQTVPQQVYVGFTASTGLLADSHQVLNWTFISTPLQGSKFGSSKSDKAKTILIVVFVILGSLVFAGFIILFVRKRLRKKRERIRRQNDIEARSRKVAGMPKEYTYKQLSKATNKFSKENLLGAGGFGSVYRGVISSNPPLTVAVKKISATSNQGEREYLAEICTIGRIRHKNIVQLHGWCHEGEHFMLVYEYMPNGSLDRFIGKDILDWETRFKILKGLASAIIYLHEESGNPVIHRDIKPNNVMLDSDYNARLGDFGLARLLDNNNSSITSMLAGTPGYLAPEAAYTGKATPESDIYSFGMVIVEVVTGQRSRGIYGENTLLNFIWTLHEKKSLIEGVDPTLEGKYDEDQVMRAMNVGLACLHPDPNFRPKIRKVEQIFLNPNEPLIDLPESRPNEVCVTLLSFSSLANSSTIGFASRETGSLLESSLSMDRQIRTDEVVAILSNQGTS